MKFTVERDALAEAVSWAARSLPARPVAPALSGMLVQADAAGLTLSCFDYEVSATAVVAAEVGEPGTALVPGRLLAEITRSLPSARVVVASAADMVTLTCGNAEFVLVGLAVDEYPTLPGLPEVAGTVDGGELATAAAQVVPSASRDDTVPMLTGVWLEFGDAAITLAATDRYRLAVAAIGWAPARAGERATALVPARTLADVRRTMTPGTEVRIAFTAHQAAGDRQADGMISFEGGGRRLTARLIGTQFVRYESRFPAQFGSRAELQVDQFAEAVRRVSLVADRASPVRLEFGRDAVVIGAGSAARARAAESVSCVFSGAEHAISFSPNYLLDGLAAAALCGRGEAGTAPGLVRLEFTSPAKPALITWADTAAGGTGKPAEFRYLVVPLRAPEAG